MFFGSDFCCQLGRSRREQILNVEQLRNVERKLKPQGHIRPQTGFTAPAFSVRSTLVGGRFAQNGAEEGETPTFQRFWPVPGPGRPPNFFKPPGPQKPVNCKLRPQEAEPSKMQSLRKLHNANAVPLIHENPDKSLVEPSYGRNGSGGGGGSTCVRPPGQSN